MGLKERIIDKKNDRTCLSDTPDFPKIIKLDVCNACNYSCIFCPTAKQKGKIGNIDHDLCKKIILDGYNCGARQLCLAMRGEPLLNSNLEEYIKYAKDTGYEYVFINTNGYLLTKERSKSLLEAGIDSIKISINSSKEHYELIHGKDGYEIVLKNVKEFYTLRKEIQSKCKFFISFVAIKQTKGGEIEEVFRDFLPYVDEIVTMNANGRAGSISEVDEEMYAGDDEYTMKWPCSQLFNTINITAEGYMITCCQDFDNYGVVGDLNKESIDEAWRNEHFVNFRKQYLK